MIINQASLNATTKSLKALYYKALEAIPDKGLKEKLAMIVTSMSETELYEWLGDLPVVKEWIDERIIEQLKAASWEIRNKEWESTISVKRKDIEFDKLGIIKPRIQQLATSGENHYIDLIVKILEAGETSKCYDGKYFFATDHPGKTAQANLFNYTLAANSYALARSTMRNYKTESGKTMRVNPNLLVVPPALETTAKVILTAEKDAAGATNIHRGTAELLVLPELTSSTAWYLMDVTKEIKAFILQKVRDFLFTALDKIDSETVFFKKEFYYGIDGVHNVGYGFWQLCFKGKGTSTLS